MNGFRAAMICVVGSAKVDWRHKIVAGGDRVKEIRGVRTLADAYVLRDVLQQEGIPATIRNEHLSGGVADAGVLGADLLNVSVADGDVQRAQLVLNEYLRDEDAVKELEALDAAAASDREGSDAHLAMDQLFLAASRLTRQPRHGESIDELITHGRFLESTLPPFGILEKAWQGAGRLAAAAVDAAVAGDEDAVQTRAAELRDALRPLV